MSREAAPTPISFRDIASHIRFRQHPKLTACWVWLGRFNDEGRPVVSSHGQSARLDVHERIIGFRPTRLKPGCDCADCVNPHHMLATS